MKIKSIILLTLLIANSSVKIFAQKSDNKKPNIVFIFIDDQIYSSVHAIGSKEIHTPIMDALVKGGTTFTHAHNMGSWSGAVCVASRTMLISGRMVWRANAVSKQLGNKQDIEKTWGKLNSLMDLAKRKITKSNLWSLIRFTTNGS